MSILYLIIVLMRVTLLLLGVLSFLLARKYAATAHYKRIQHSYKRRTVLVLNEVEDEDIFGLIKTLDFPNKGLESKLNMAEE